MQSLHVLITYWISASKPSAMALGQGCVDGHWTKATVFLKKSYIYFLLKIEIKDRKINLRGVFCKRDETSFNISMSFIIYGGSWRKSNGGRRKKSSTMWTFVFLKFSYFPVSKNLTRNFLASRATNTGKRYSTVKR